YRWMNCVPGNASTPRRRTSIAIGEPPWAYTRNDETSRGRTDCSSTEAATIVGTPSVWVIRSVATRSSIVPGSNAGTITWQAPTKIDCSRLTDPAAWNIGAITRYRSCALSGWITWTFHVLAIRFRWVSITPLLV